MNTIGTWQEQRYWGFDAPLEALEDHELKEIIEKEINELTIQEPDLSDFREVEDLEDLEVDHFVFSIHKKTGGLSRLLEKSTGREWCDDSHQIGLFQYDVYNSEDYDKYEFLIL